MEKSECLFPLFIFTISDYVRALENPFGLFRTLGEPAVERDVYGEVELRAGNSAAVFTYTDGHGRKRFLKCYVRPNPYLNEIYRYIELKRPPLLAEARLMRAELYVRTLSGNEGWADIAEGGWLEGETLDAAVARAAKQGDVEKLAGLAAGFDELCRELLAQEWAHGDLKPDNIIVGGDGRMSLVDCDAMWLPDFDGMQAAELGTPGYRHPGRRARHFGKYIDDYPAMLISVSLHGLAIEPALYTRYNTTDNIIFTPSELTAGTSAAFAAAAELFAVNGMARELRMLEACCSPLIETEPAAAAFFEMRQGVGIATGGENAGMPISFVRGGKWGFADAEGRTVIPPHWDEALDFRGGFSAVRLGRWWHRIDATGGIVRRGMSPDELKSVLR